MAPIERSAVAIATPEAIWKACFEHMKFELWDPDVTELIDVSGGCENGTTFMFVMKDGSGPIPMVLSDTVENKSPHFLWHTHECQSGRDSCFDSLRERQDQN